MKGVERSFYYILVNLISIILPAHEVLAGEGIAGEIRGEMSRQFDSFLFGRQILFGTFLGFLIGFTLKKSLKILLFAAGVVAIIMIIMSKYDLVLINWANFEELYTSFAAGYDFAELFNQAYLWLSDSIAVTGSFGVGFVIGIKVG